MADIDAIAKQFTDFYYTTFDENRAKLISLYHQESTLSLDGTRSQGNNAISEKLVGLPFVTVQHKVITIDAQISNPAVQSIIVSVTGYLVVDDAANTLQFSQIFHLIPNGDSYYVLNDIFRFINLG